MSVLRIGPNTQKLSCLDAVLLAERYELRQLILNSHEAFIEAIGRELFVVASDVQLSIGPQTRCDLLAIDRQANVVVVVVGQTGPNQADIPKIVKRDDPQVVKDQSLLMRGMTCATMVARMKLEGLLELASAEQAEGLGMFLLGPVEQINQRQQILLVAEAYEAQFLTTLQWLAQRNGVSVTCVRVTFYRDSEANAEYLSCREEVFRPVEQLKPIASP